MQSRTMKIAACVAAAGLLVFTPKVKATNPTLVQVVNSILQWIPIRSLDEPGRNPIEAEGVMNQPGVVQIYTVPDNYRLVIKQVSAACFTQKPVVTGILYNTVNSVQHGAIFPLVQTQWTVSGLQQAVASVPVEYYADPGTTVSGTVQNTGAFGEGGQCDITISGYLVTLNPPSS